MECWAITKGKSMWRLLALGNLTCDQAVSLYILRSHVSLYNPKKRGILSKFLSFQCNGEHIERFHLLLINKKV